MPTSTVITGGNVTQDVQIADGKVVASIESLKIDVRGFKYDIGGLRGVYAGALGQSVTDDDTNYVYWNTTPSLQINTTGFPSEIHIPLARVVTANGEVVAIYEERVLLASSSSSVGTCIISLPVDGDIRGGDTAAGSNNDWAAVVYQDTGTGEARNRLVRRTPRNYVDGDLVIRVVASVPNAIPSTPTRQSRWDIQYKFASVGESLGSLASVSNSFTHNDQAADELFAISLTIPEVNVDMTKEFMAFQLNRDNDHADDNLGEDIYVHNVEIRYNGYRLAGQAGQ